MASMIKPQIIETQLREDLVVTYEFSGYQPNKALVYLPDSSLVLRHFARDESDDLVVRTLTSKLSDVDFTSLGILLHRDYTRTQDLLERDANFTRYSEQLLRAGLEIPAQKPTDKDEMYRKRILARKRKSDGISPREDLGRSLVAPIGGYR